MLATHPPPGTPVSRAPAVLASLGQALRRPEGCASYDARRHWLRQTQGVGVKDKTLYALVRTRFKAKLTGARPSHPKHPRGASRVPGDVWGTPPGGHPAHEHPPGARVQPR